ncbi:MAG: hypothetical protein VB045_00500 [Synergistaceae bacterium]|nr:hypothetical protein [Synergistaceae bacterium]
MKRTNSCSSSSSFSVLSSIYVAQNLVRFATSNTDTMEHVYGAAIAAIVNKHPDRVSPNTLTTFDGV